MACPSCSSLPGALPNGGRCACGRLLLVRGSWSFRLGPGPGRNAASFLLLSVPPSPEEEVRGALLLASAAEVLES